MSGIKSRFNRKDRIAVEDALAKFTAAMWHQLDNNAEKGTSWRDDSQQALLIRMREESEELAEVIPPSNPTIQEMNEVMKEAADVANFALFIFDNALRKRDELIDRDIEDGVIITTKGGDIGNC